MFFFCLFSNQVRIDATINQIEIAKVHQNQTKQSSDMHICCKIIDFCATNIQTFNIFIYQIISFDKYDKSILFVFEIRLDNTEIILNEKCITILFTIVSGYFYSTLAIPHMSYFQHQHYYCF